MKFSLAGPIAAAFTPFAGNGSLEISTIARLLELYVESGVGGVFVAGTTGECHSLTVEERQQLTTEWVRVGKGKLPIVVHVGHNSLPDARALATHAQEAGADALAAMAPFFFKPSNVTDLVDYLAAIASAAPRLPFYFYDIPCMTGVQLPTAQILQQSMKRIPNFVGLKFTSQDLMTYLECRAVSSQLDCLYGHDEMLLAAMSLGARGAIGATHNYAAPVYVRLMQAFDRGDLDVARREQLKSVQLVRALVATGVLRGGKAIMQMMGVDCGSVRLPLKDLTPQERETLYRAVCDLDVFARQIRPIA